MKRETTYICIIGSGILEVPSERGGGIPQVIENLVKNYPENYAVHIITTKYRNNNSSQNISNTVQWHYVKIPGLPVKGYPPSKYWSKLIIFPLIIYSFISAAIIFQLSRKYGGKWILHSHNRFVSLAPFIIGKSLHMKTVYTEHNVSPWLYKRGGLVSTTDKMNIFWSRFVFRYTDAVICISENLCDSMIQYSGVQPNKLFFIPNGTNIPSNSVKEKRTNRILFIGRLNEVKNPLLLAKASPHVLKEIPSAEFVFLGDGELKDKIIDFAEKNEVVGNIKLEGVVPNSKVRKYLKNCSIVVFLSPVENFPSLAMLEALAFGRGVIATDVGDTKKILIDNYNSSLIKTNSPEELALKMIELLKNPKKIEELGLNAKKSIEPYSWKNIAKKTLDVYQQVLGSET